MITFFLSILGKNPFQNLQKSIDFNGASYKYFDIASFGTSYGKCIMEFDNNIRQKVERFDKIVYSSNQFLLIIIN